MLQNIDASGCAWRISKKKKGAWFAKNDGFFYFLKRLRINGYSVSMYTLSVLMCTKCTHYVYGFWSFSLFFFYRRIKKGRGQIILWSLLFYFYLCKYFFGKLYKSTLGFVDYSQNEYMKLLIIVYHGSWFIEVLLYHFYSTIAPVYRIFLHIL